MPGEQRARLAEDHDTRQQRFLAQRVLEPGDGRLEHVGRQITPIEIRVAVQFRKSAHRAAAGFPSLMCLAEIPVHVDQKVLINVVQRLQARSDFERLEGLLLLRHQVFLRVLGESGQIQHRCPAPLMRFVQTNVRAQRPAVGPVGSLAEAAGDQLMREGN
ncbi:MAG: hypothetical protein DMF51_10355 [Acidobacteria bacterium]|nr:MAG: hypothetical protein DMF51_10355 [Acidobacteriota bacterium]